MANLKQKLFSRKINPAFLTRVKDMMVYTPDAAYLEQFERQFLFVPDNWMMGHIDHSNICHEELVYPTAFTHDQYSMVYKPLGIESYPVILEVSKETEDSPGWTDPNRKTLVNKQARVRGQVWAITPSLFRLKLDKERENGYTFLRKRVTIDIPVRKVQEGDTKYCVSNAEDELLVCNYKGERVYFQISFVGNLKVYQRKMWMYVGVKEYWKDMLHSVDDHEKGFELPSARIFRPRNPILKDYFYWLREGEHNK